MTTGEDKEISELGESAKRFRTVMPATRAIRAAGSRA